MGIWSSINNKILQQSGIISSSKKSVLREKHSLGKSESNKGIPSRFRIIPASKGKIRKRGLQPSGSSTRKKKLHTTLEAFLQKGKTERQIQKTRVLQEKTDSLLEQAKIQERISKQLRQKAILSWVQKEAQIFLDRCEEEDELDISESDFDEVTTEQSDSMDETGSDEE